MRNNQTETFLRESKTIPDLMLKLTHLSNLAPAHSLTNTSSAINFLSANRIATLISSDILELSVYVTVKRCDLPTHVHTCKVTLTLLLYEIQII